MICKTCGRQVNEEANFCEYCGASQRDRIPVMEEMKQPTVIVEQKMEEIKFGEWVKLFALALLPLIFIPYLGVVFSVLFLVYLGFINKEVPVSKKNWARVMLLVVGCLIIFFNMVMNAVLIISPDFPADLQNFISDFMSGIQPEL